MSLTQDELWAAVAVADTMARAAEAAHKAKLDEPAFLRLARDAFAGALTVSFEPIDVSKEVDVAGHLGTLRVRSYFGPPPFPQSPPRAGKAKAGKRK